MTRVAIIGSGIAGLGAAWELDRSGRCDVTIFEAEDWIGGHTCTVAVPGPAGSLPVDMGSIVHDPHACPRLVAMVDEFGVATRRTEMSFSVACRGCGLEYSSRAIGRQLDRYLRPRMIRMMHEVRRFRREGRVALADPGCSDLTLAAFVASRHYSSDMVCHYLVPLVCAIWSTSPHGALDFPARAALAFLDDHGFLQARGHEWRTVVGGSHAFVDAILGRIGGEVRRGAPVISIRRGDAGVDVLAAGAARPERFDHVVLATHADTSLALLDDADALERELLGAFEFTVNEAILHDDPAMLPRRTSSVSAWNCRLAGCAGTDDRPTITHSMNRLQGLATDRPLSVTLNRGPELDPGRVIARRQFAQPRYTHRSIAAQGRLQQLDSRRRTSYCGAWQGFGLHEDGLRSGQRVAGALLERLRDAPSRSKG